MNASGELPVGIIGAGVAGLTAAVDLLTAGREVHLIDKGRGVGGRLATRRIGAARLDHGAQFFTVRGEAFRDFIDDAIQANVVDVWCNGFDGEDGHPRYYCPGGMTALAKWVAADVVDHGGSISLAERVQSIHAEADRWTLPLESGGTVQVSDLIVTSPVPQSLDLVDAGTATIDAEVRQQLEVMTYIPTIGLLVTLDGPPTIPSPGAVQQTQEDLFSFIADNQQKGISAEPAVTLHANGSFSTRRWDDDPDEVLTELLSAATAWFGSATVVDAQLKKWKFATPLVPHADRCVVAAEVPGALVLAGDGFGGPKVEGAFNSGRAAAAALTSG